MFAPKVATPQTKAAENPPSGPAPRPSTLMGHRVGCDPIEQALFLQRSIGNQGTLRLLSRRAWRAASEAAPEHTARETVIEPKLVIERADDPLEHEADRIADQVVRGPRTAVAVAPAPAQISRKCAACDEEEQAQTLQAKTAGTSQPSVRAAPGIVQDVLRTPGQPLDADSRAFFEPRLRSNLGQVRIHADTRAAESARAVDARAYTVGQHVVFGRDRYAPGTADGRHLLAHELAHTLQQRGGTAGLQRAPDPPPPPPPRPDLGDRLRVIEENGPAAEARLTNIIENGGPIPQTTKVIGAAIVEVEGYDGHTELRAINGIDGDAMGAGAPVFHAPTPTDRALTGTQGARTARGGREPSITGPRRESINPHLNDVEVKLFEYIIPRLPKGAKGTIWFTSWRVRMVNGTPNLEPYPACSGCIRASFETAGLIGEVDLVSQAPVHPPLATGDLGEGGDPSAPGGQGPAKPGTLGTDVEPGGQAGKPSKPAAPTAAKPATPSTETHVEPGGQAGKPSKPAAPMPAKPAAPSTETHVEPGGQAGAASAPAAPTPAKPATPSTGTHVEPGGQAGKPSTPAAPAPAKPAAPSTETHAEPAGPVAGGQTAPATKATASMSRSGRFTGVAFDLGTGLASIGLGLLSAYLKQKVDERQAAQQIDALLEWAKNQINQNPDEAVQKMMVAPEVRVFAWVHLSNAVITFFEAGSISAEPTTSSSSPMYDLLTISYHYQPVPQELVDTFSGFSGGGRHLTTLRTLIIDIPLKTPPIEDMIDYAKTRHLDLYGLLDYALYRYGRSAILLGDAIREKGDVQARTQEESYWKNIVDLIQQGMPRH